MDELRTAAMARTLQANEQAFHFIESHVICRKARDILRESVKSVGMKASWCRDASSRIWASVEPEVMRWTCDDMMLP